MPIIGSPTSSTDLEGFVLDGLDLNDNATFRMVSVDFTPPRQRQEWIGAADSEHQALVRDPLHENRKITARIVVVPQADMDAALTQIATANDKLRKASKYTDGIELVWAPASGTFECTFDVLAGEITALPVDPETGWFAYNPEFSIELTCKPYFRREVVTTSTASSSTPFVTLEIPDVGGDVPALGILTVTDTATQARRHVEWGLEGPLTYDPATVLLLDSDSLVTSGFSGTQATLAGAYDPNADANDAIQVVVLGQPQAACGTGVLSHVGTFRVTARINSGPVGCDSYFRLAWRVGNGSYSTNDAVRVTTTMQAFWEIDLGTLTIPVTVAGTQAWDGRVECYSAAGQQETLYIDYLMLIPTGAGYGKARATYSYQPGVVVARDAFTGTTAAAVLHGRTADAGGTWATSGATTDFAFVDTVDGVTREAVARSTVSDASARFAILGSTSFTNVEVQTALRRSTTPTGTAGVIARWTDASNYLRGELVYSTAVPGSQAVALTLTERAAGVDTVIATVTVPTLLNAFLVLRLVALTSGRVSLTLLDAAGTTGLASLDAASATLATGGTLATGKPGIIDYNTSSTAGARNYDDFFVSTPGAESVALYSGRTLQFRHDDTIRDDSTGVYIGRPQSYRGSRFLLPIGTSRVLVKARRNDVEASTNDNVTDATQIGVSYTPRGLAVPR